MSDPFGDRPFPRGALLGAAGVLAMTLSFAAYSRLTGASTTALPPAPRVSARELWFVDQADGAVAVVDARTNENIQVLPAKSNGFLRATLRTFVRDRRSRGLDASAPFHLAASADGRLRLDDPATGRNVELEAFGHTNAATFAAFLEKPHD
jgi:putative photosynthetic complex assembly protein